MMLSPTEFRILSLLAQHAGKVVSRETLAKEIWGPDRADVDGYLLKLHIQHLRRKMGDSGAHPELVITVHGFGYKVPA
jgi:DNA-binding response OmpR family regulator